MSKKELREYYKDKPVKPTFFTLKNDSVSLFCATTGADTLPPLLFIHGAPGAWYGSRDLMNDAELRKHYHIIAVDRPGYNNSRFKKRRKAVTSITTQAVAIHEAMQLNHSSKTGVIVGSSYGGPIGLKMAVLYPHEFHRLVMLAGAIDPDKEKFWWFSPYAQDPLVQLLVPRFLNHATDEKFAHEEELRKLLPDWKRVSIPVTIVQGGADTIVDPENLEFAKKQLQGKEAEYIFLPNAGHLIRFQNAGLVKSILLKDTTGGTNGH